MSIHPRPWSSQIVAVCWRIAGLEIEPVSLPGPCELAALGELVTAKVCRRALSLAVGPDYGR